MHIGARKIKLQLTESGTFLGTYTNMDSANITPEIVIFPQSIDANQGKINHTVA